MCSSFSASTSFPGIHSRSENAMLMTVLDEKRPSARSLALTQPYCSLGRMGELERHDSPWTRVATSHSVTYAPVRKSNAYVRAMYSYVVDLFASIVAAARVLCAFDVFLSLAFTTTSTCLYWFLDMGAAVNISWTAVSFAIIIPITSGISLSFQRREKALAELGMLLGHLTSIWSCAHSWLVPSTRKEGGPKLVLLLDNFVEAPEQKREELRTLFDALLVALIAYLDAERWGRARNTIRCIGGDVEQCERMAIAHGSRMQFAGHMHRVRVLCQDFKRAGLDGGQCHRLDQYVTIALAAYERLCAINECVALVQIEPLSVTACKIHASASMRACPPVCMRIPPAMLAPPNPRTLASSASAPLWRTGTAHHRRSAPSLECTFFLLGPCTGPILLSSAWATRAQSGIYGSHCCSRVARSSSSAACTVQCSLSRTSSHVATQACMPMWM